MDFKKFVVKNHSCTPASKGMSRIHLDPRHGNTQSIQNPELILIKVQNLNRSTDKIDKFELFSRPCRFLNLCGGKLHPSLFSNNWRLGGP